MASRAAVGQALFNYLVADVISRGLAFIILLACHLSVVLDMAVCTNGKGTHRTADHPLSVGDRIYTRAVGSKAKTKFIDMRVDILIQGEAQ
jgi:hypothetical protein